MTTLQQRILESIRGLNRRANAVLLAFVLAALAQTTAAQQYQLSYLDDLGGNSRGNSINNRGWILGFSLLSGFPQRNRQEAGIVSNASQSDSPTRCEADPSTAEGPGKSASIGRNEWSRAPIVA